MCLLCGRGEPRRPTRNTTLATVVMKSWTEKVSTSKCHPTKNLSKFVSNWKNLPVVNILKGRATNLMKIRPTEADYSFNCSNDLKKPNCCCKNETDCVKTVAGHLLVFEKYLSEMKVRLTTDERQSEVIARISDTTDSLKDVAKNISSSYKVKGNSSIITCTIGPDVVNRRLDLLAQFTKEITVFLKHFQKNIGSKCKVKDNFFQGNSTRRGESGGSTGKRGGSSGERRVSSGERETSYEENKGNSGGRRVSSGENKGSSGGGGRNNKGRGGSSGGREGSSRGREGSSRGRGGSSGGREGSSRGRKGSSRGRKGSSRGKEGSSRGKGGSSREREGSSRGRGGSSRGKGGSSGESTKGITE